MDKLIAELTSRLGLDQATAEKVAQYIKENAHRLPELLPADVVESLKGRLPGGLGGILGGKG